MNLRCQLVVMSVCIGGLLSGCTGEQDKKTDPKPSTLARGKVTPETKSEEKPAKEKTPSEKGPPKADPVKVEAPKPPKEIAKATSDAWTKSTFTTGFMGTDQSGAVVFASALGNLRGAVPAFDAHTATTDAALIDLPSADVPFGLKLSNSKITDVGLKFLAGHKNLTALELVYTKVTDTGLKDLAKLPNLGLLNLRSTEVTDAGLKELAGLARLSALDLANNKVTDAGLKALGGLKGLTSLDLSLTDVTDLGLKELVGLKDLVSLRLGSTKVTDAGVEELRKALPKCVIVK